VFIRNKTSLKYVYYALYLYFSGLSLRRISQRLSCFVKRNHVSIWNWIQKYHPKRIASKSRKFSEYIVDETILKVGSEYIWLWVAIELTNRQILAVTVSKERNMFIAERFLSNIVKEYGKQHVSSDGGTWYPMACWFLKLKHHIHSPLEKSLLNEQCSISKTEPSALMTIFLAD